MNYSKYSESRNGNAMTPTVLYQHMTSHYRRIINAKPIVDSSPPKTFKPRVSRRTNSPFRIFKANLSGSLCSSQEFVYGGSPEAQLIDKIVACEKYSPAVVCSMEWSSKQRSLLSDKKSVPAQKSRTGNIARHPSSHPVRPRVPADVLERHRDQFEALGTTFWPRILKTDAESKLKHMRVYHPPKRKTSKNPEWPNKEVEKEAQQCSCRGVCTCSHIGTQPECKEQSQTSSRDSAYNGGMSSTPESRSPTPYQRKQRGTSKEGNERQCSHIGTQTEPVHSGSWRPSRKHSHKRKESEDDSAYTKFIHDITQEVLDSGSYSDKSLGRIITRNMAANTHHLKKEKMLKEVEKLKKQLGIQDNGDDFEETVSNEYVSQLQFSTDTVKNGEGSTKTPEPESWPSFYKYLSSDKQTDDIDVSVKVASSDTFSSVNTAETLSENDLLKEEEVNDSVSSKAPTIKDFCKSDEREGSEISSEIDSADENSQE